ncbi:GIY-YIG nuclease family protein [Methanoregula sp.]|uniref:GIY-YIG nuclease family protein n=1 Tax=Methanoregula sp. TaxID=2052170 RepID=UPI00344D1DF9
MDIKWSLIHELNSGDISKYAPTSSGVYVIWVHFKDGKWRCHYTGQAENLEQRLYQHISSSESNTSIKSGVSKFRCGYCTAEVGSQANRNGIELYLYQTYKPEWNDITPPGTSPIQVNLP